MLYVLDTNTVIFLTKDDEDVWNVLENKLSEDKFNIPPLVYYEVMRGFKYVKAVKRLENFKNLYKTTFTPAVNELEVMNHLRRA